ncbi:MAG: glycosyltransferase family 4 protein [Deltaproteobacteria bacterium]|nr:glycosyltransferase family 4 protein [Deltaproteobacteria bacterium]
MKILYTTHQFLPDYAAGTEILTYSTAKEIARRGHEVCIFTGYPVKGAVAASHAFDRYEHDGISVDRFFYSNTSSIRPRNPMEAEYNNLFFADFFRRRIQELKPDLVHFYHLQRLSAAAIDVCHELKIPTVFTATDFWLICPTNQLLLPDHSRCLGPDKGMVNCVRHLAAISQGQRIRSILDRLPNGLMAVLIRWVKCAAFRPEKGIVPLVHALASRPAYMEKRMNRIGLVLVATRFMGEMLHRYGLEEKKIRHVPFGIDRTHIMSVSTKGTAKHLRIGFIGTLYSHKGAHVLLEAVRSLPTEMPLEVKIYGELEQFPEYAKTLRSVAGNDHRIAFCGTFPNHSIGDIFNRLDVLIIPSLWYENSPLVLSFAQAARVPVVATDSEGMNEVIANGENGFRFERGDVKRLADIIRMLCNDRSVVKHLSDHARQPKSISSYVDELERIYDDVVHCRTVA